MRPEEDLDLSVVIVTWNVAERLRSCLLSLQAESRTSGLSLEVLVVDNASRDHTLEMLGTDFPWVVTIRNEENRGFAAGCNQGISASRGRYLLLLNPDTELLPGFLRAMFDYLSHNSPVGAVGPKLLNTDLTVQSSRRRFPNLTTAIFESTPLQRLFSHLPSLQRYYCEDVPDDVVQEVDWLVGACLMIRRETLREVGPLDERFFMYFEEVDWFLRAKGANWSAVYLPEARVIHHSGQSSAQDLLRRHVNFNNSKCKFFSKHWGRAAGWTLRGFLLGAYCLQLLEEGLKLVLGHKRGLRRERLRTLLGALRTGLR